jgi:hypothetical protein
MKKIVPGQGRFVMLIEIACRALEMGKCLELGYDGFTRVVEVHAVGAKKGGTEAMRVWQVRGGSGSDEPTGFRLLNLDEPLEARMIEEKSRAPRFGYKQRDKALTVIYCRL